MKDGLILSALSVIPKNRVTRLMGLFARSRLPRAGLRVFLRWYVRHYGADMSESERPLDSFDTFTDFFTRSLRPGLRPVDQAPDALVAPCDGRIYAIGAVAGGSIPQADGLDYAVAELLGGDHGYDAGSFAVIYLSPRDYHRVHTPREGAVTRFRYVPGRLWPVFPAATRRIPGLFAQNERLTTYVETDIGPVAVVMVGAFGVGRIRVVYDEVVSNAGHPDADRALPVPFPVARAGELGRFEMGSTVILLVRGHVDWTVRAGDAVRLGSAIGRVGARQPAN